MPSITWSKMARLHAHIPANGPRPCSYSSQWPTSMSAFQPMAHFRVHVPANGSPPCPHSSTKRMWRTHPLLVIIYAQLPLAKTQSHVHTQMQGEQKDVAFSRRLNFVDSIDIKEGVTDWTFDSFCHNIMVISFSNRY